MGDGYRAFLVTLTVRHRRQDNLVDLFTGLGSAWKMMTSGRIWDGIRKAYEVEYVRGYDLTHGKANGWHPHNHLGVYVRRRRGVALKPCVPVDERAVADWLAARWIECLGVVGYDALDDAQDVQECHDPEAAARYSVTPAAVYETLAMAMKRARTGADSRTPFEILEAAVMADDAASRMLWIDYVTATKGRRQVHYIAWLVAGCR
jgi:hypothetical protein